MLLMNCPYFERQKYSLILTVSGFIDGLSPLVRGGLGCVHNRICGGRALPASE